MSKLTEYLKLIPAGLKNIDKVVEGIKNNIKIELGTISDEDMDEITRRRLICASCPYESDNLIKRGLYITKREDVHCTMCGCPITTKTASLESNCGIETYNQNNPQTPLPLKWEKVK